MKYLRNLFSKIEHFFKRLATHWRNPQERKLIIRDTFLISIIVAIVALGAFVLWAASLKTPDLNSFDDRLLGQSAKIYDRTGTILLYDLSQKVKRTVVPSDQIPQTLKDATVSIEDASFYSHKGIKVTSIIRAFLADVLSLHFSQGGSTITQQVVKNSLLTTNKSITRKLKEWILAIKLERVATKDEILNLYLNDSPYGGNIYGVAEASEEYFGKQPSELTLAESAYLAAIPQAPTYYSPYGTHKSDLDTRKNLVLKKMLDYGKITQDQYTEAVNENVVFQPHSINGIKAPHFVMFIKQYLEDKYGDELLEKGGFKVITTLDYDLQSHAEDIVKNYVTSNEKNFKANNGALVAIDPETGQILAMVGSRDYFDTEIDGQFNVATAHRQPGSSFKPFVYATAFNEGFTPDTPIYDVFTEFNASCNYLGVPKEKGAVCYHPQNYEGGYQGLMTLRTALAQSRNIPAVRLLYMVGIDNSIRTAQAMGIESLASSSRYGLTLVLGGGEVSPLDMASAYGVFADDGQRNPYTGILSIEDSSGSVMESYATSTQQVLPVQTARLMNDVLSDPYARSSIFGSQYFGDKRVAIKTGTTNDSRDAWIVGYTPNLSVSAWMGNNDDSPMVQKASALIVAPMWKKFMDYALQQIPNESFTPPEPIDPTIKPFLQGVWQGPGNEVHSELYWIDRNDPAGPPPADPTKDGLYENFEFGVNGWTGSAAGQKAISAIASSTQNTATTSTSTASQNTGAATGFRINSPANLSSLNKDARVNIVVGNIPQNATKVDYYINSSLVGTATVAPFSFSFIPSQVAGIEDEDELKAIVTDSQGGTQQSSILFSVI